MSFLDKSVFFPAKIEKLRFYQFSLIVSVFLRCRDDKKMAKLEQLIKD